MFDCLKDAFDVVADLRVGEAQDVPALGLEVGRAAGVVGGLVGVIVGAAVEFDGEVDRAGGEVEDVGWDGVLAGEARREQAQA